MTSSAVAVQNGNLSVVQPDFTATQIDLISHTIGFAPGTAEFDLFMNLCRAKRLDPLTRQIYGIKTSKGLQMFASIDGLRVIAQRSGQYAGQVGPFWCGEDGEWQDVWLAKEKPAAAKIGVLRKGWTEPMWGVATLKSYGKESPTWNAMPDVMLAKVAESMALRKAFPDDLSALYVREEFGEADEPIHQGNVSDRHGNIPKVELRSGPTSAATAPTRAHTAIDAGPAPDTTTARQMRYILAVAKQEHNLDKDGADELAIREFGKPIAELSRRDASAFVDLLPSLKPTPVVEVVNADTGEISTAEVEAWRVVKQDTARLAGLLNLSAKDVVAHAVAKKIDYRTPDGAVVLRDALKAIHEANERAKPVTEDEEDYEGIEAAQGTLLDAETAPIEREY